MERIHYLMLGMLVGWLGCLLIVVVALSMFH